MSSQTPGTPSGQRGRADIVRADKQFVWHPYTPMDRYVEETDPLVIDRAEGALLFEAVTALRHDGDLEIHVARVVGGRRDADVHRPADQHDGVDVAAAQGQLEMRAVKGRPAVLGHVVVAGLRRDLGEHRQPR